jgi:hypothetical protein
MMMATFILVTRAVNTRMRGRRRQFVDLIKTNKK